ncbi:MAG: carbohydrate ABC transporter permease [Clostridiales bacterium]|jgi:putative aldouronate transport system permease protein|nr:carbohydrate ABC transporter permease [Clostridiales bacterium]
MFVRRATPGLYAIRLVLFFYALVCVLPFILILVTSFATETSVIRNGYSFFPSELSLEAYRMLINPSSSLPGSYAVSSFSTLVGTLIGVAITYGAGYTLANRQCKYRNALALYFFVTMVFSAGMVPWYMVSRALGCYDNIWALIVPSLMFSPFNMFLVRNFVREIPDSLNESARIDGANEFLIAVRIYFPLCLPVLATITLFYAIGYWNNYFNAVMLVNKPELFNLQMLLFKIQSEIKMLSSVAVGVTVNPPRESFKMATCVVTMGPIILLYPFLQRYFVKGMTVGAVKG